MSEERNFPESSKVSVEDPDFISSSSDLIAQDSSQDADEKLGSSKVSEDITHRIEKLPFIQIQFPIVTHAKKVQTSEVKLSINNDFLRDPGDYFNSGNSSFSQTASAQGVGCKTISSKKLEDKTSMLENTETVYSHISSIVLEKNNQTSNIPLVVDNAFSNKETSDNLDSEIKHTFPENTSHQTSRIKVLPLNPVEDVSSVENPCSLQTRVPCITYGGNIPTSETAMNTQVHFNKEHKLQFSPVDDSSLHQFPSTRQNIGNHFSNEYSPSIHIGNNHKQMEFNFDEQSVSLQMGDRSLLMGREDKYSDIDVSSSTNDKDQNITNRNQFDTAYQLGALSGGSNPKMQSNDDKLQKCKIASQLKGEFFENYCLPNKMSEVQSMQNAIAFYNDIQYLGMLDRNNTFAHQRNQLSNRRENTVIEYSNSSNIGKEKNIAMRTMPTVDIENTEEIERNIKLRLNPDFAQNGEIILPTMPKNIPFETYLSNKNQHIPNKILFDNNIHYLEKHKGRNAQVQYIDLQNLLMDNFAPKYRLLYALTFPKNYDFAMNIMAYVEILNNTSWEMSNSFLNESVKMMIKNIWNKNKDFFNNRTELPTASKDTFELLITIFTNRILSSNCDLGHFLNYCVLMCQTGVLARERGFQEVPLRVIEILRQGIKTFEFSQQVLFEICVQKHALDRIC